MKTKTKKKYNLVSIIFLVSLSSLFFMGNNIIRNPTVKDLNDIELELSVDPPLQVTNLTYSYLNDTIILHWFSPLGLNTTDHYNIYRDGIKIGEQDYWKFYYEDNTCEKGIIYEYQVSVIDIYGQEGSKSDLLRVIAHIWNLYVIESTETYITLSWNPIDNPFYIAYYNIYRGGVYVARVDMYYNLFHDINLTPDTTYEYQVSSINFLEVESPKSEVIYASTSIDPLPSQVTGLIKGPVNLTSIVISWDTHPDNDIDHYNVYRDSVKIGETEATFYVDINIESDTYYLYHVTAVDIDGNEGYSSSELSVKSIGFLRVVSISMSFWKSLLLPIFHVTAKIHVTNDHNISVASVRVTVSFNYPNGNLGFFSGYTNSNGIVSFKIWSLYFPPAWFSIRKPWTCSCTVIDVEKPVYIFDSSSSVISNSVIVK